MGLTLTEETDAVAYLDGDFTKTPQKIDGKYVHVLPVEEDGIHTTRMDEYVGPLGVGYTRVVSRGDDKGDVWQCAFHTGPEKYRDAQNGVWVNVSVGIDGVVAGDLAIPDANAEAPAK